MTSRRLSYSSSGRRPCDLCITCIQVPPCPSTVEVQSCGPRRSLVVTPRHMSAYVRHTLGDSVTLRPSSPSWRHQASLLETVGISTDHTTSLEEEVVPYCSGITPRYDKPSLKVGELSGMCQPLAQGGDKSRQTTQSHWRVLQACVLYARTKRGFKQ